MEDSPSEQSDTFVYPHVPNLKIADLKFACAHDPDDRPSRDALREAIIENSMVHLHKECEKEIPGWQIDPQIVTQMETENAEALLKMDKAIADAEENFGVSEIREALFAKIKFLCNTGDFKAASQLIETSLTKKAMSTLSSQLDLKMYQIRCLLFDLKRPGALRRAMEDATKTLQESGSADWDRKNRLKVYEAVVAFHTTRDFRKAVRLFLETLPTYNCYEILSHNTFINYTVLLGMISLDRPQLREAIVKNSEICQVLYNEPEIREFLSSLFDCRYRDFFLHLAKVEQRLKRDRYWYPHYRHYVRELQIIAYNQHLESYSSLSLSSLADAFGVSTEMIDRDLSRLIASGRSNCKIDKVNGLVNTRRPDDKNAQYQELIRKGDILLNRIQKLSRVISL